MPLKPLIDAAAASMWGFFSEFVEKCYYFTPGPVNQGTTECLIRPVPHRLVDGTAVKVGDSVAYIPAAQMASVSHPVPGDYLLTLGGTKRWDVLAGQLNISQSLMILVVRRAY